MSAEHCFELLNSNKIEELGNKVRSEPECARARDSAGISLLMHCLYRGQKQLAELIASAKKDLDLFEAASLGRLDRLRELADPSRVNARSADGFTALHFAAFFGQPSAAKILIENGAAVDAVAGNSMKVMPLHSAASARNLETVRLLLENGAPPNARQQSGWTPLHAAAQNGDSPMIELMLKSGADPNAMNDDGKTPAATAREKGHAAIAARLEAAAGNPPA